MTPMATSSTTSTGIRARGGTTTRATRRPCGSTTSSRAGVAYTMYGAWGPMPDGPDEDSGDSRRILGRGCTGHDDHLVVVLKVVDLVKEPAPAWSRPIPVVWPGLPCGPGRRAGPPDRPRAPRWTQGISLPARLVQTADFRGRVPCGGITFSPDVRLIPMMPLRPEPRGDIAVGEGGALAVAASALLLPPLLVRPSGGSTAVHWGPRVTGRALSRLSQRSLISS